MRQPITTLLLISLSLVALFSLTTPTLAEKLNVVYILADDLGYGDLGCYGSTINKTPNLDKLAEGGLRLTNFYAAAWCAPSRVALMTGNHSHRPGLMGKKQNSRLADCTTIPEMLKAEGYKTLMIGKWHLGMSKGCHPLDQGFESWFGTIGSNDWDGPRPDYAGFKNAPMEAWKTPHFRNRKNLGVIPQDQFVQRYTQEALQLIDANKDEPFFLYLAHNVPHVPVYASEKFKGKSKNGRFGDVVEELDWSVGQVLDAIKKAGIEKKTLVVFTSDNGPWIMFPEFAGVATPLRGQKSTCWEGGFRVPTIFYLPGKIKPGVSDELIAVQDLYATIATLTGAKVKAGEAIDSQDFSQVLLEGGKSQRENFLFCRFGAIAYRSGDYKIHFATFRRGRDPVTSKREPEVKQKPPLLFNVKKDPGEKVDIAAEYPEVVERLTDEFNAAKKKLNAWEKF